MAQWLRALAVLRISFPFPACTWVAHNYLQLQLLGIQCLSWSPWGTRSYMAYRHTDTRIHNLFLKGLSGNKAPLECGGNSMEGDGCPDRAKSLEKGLGRGCGQAPGGDLEEELYCPPIPQLSLDLFYTEDEIYELSYAREPRCSKSLPPSPYKAPLVLEWAHGVTPKPDSVTLGQHVEQLVASVFKNYDPEGHGTISLEDFERLAGNFPFACHGLHPPPRHGSGSFSREELTEYLLRASAICSKLGLAFLHTFHEVTFRKPAFCHSCSGFLWGVNKQGYRCRDCGLCCHRHCRDQVRVECKKRPETKGDPGPPGAPVPATPQPPASCGSEENLSYTLSPDAESGCHLRHAWTQTESSHSSWETEMVPSPAPAPSSNASSKPSA